MYRSFAIYSWSSRRILARCVVAAMALAACGGGGETVVGCDPVITEPLAGDWLLHVLPGAEAEYLSDPPTSGPHIAWQAPALLERPLSPAEQVGVLETGDVLVQYRPADVDADALDALAGALPSRTHLAPNAGLPSAVVLTAHLTKQTCASLSTEAVERFAEDYVGEPVG